MSPATPRLHIRRLVLRGFHPLDAQRLRDAFAAALAEPLALAAAPAPGAGCETLRLSVTDPGSPEALGRAAAQALRESLRESLNEAPR